MAVTGSTDREEKLQRHLDEHNVYKNKSNEICWKPDSKQHPLNWGLLPKYYTTSVVIWLECYMTVLSSSGAAAAVGAQKDYGISKELTIFAFITVYLLGQTLGGIVCSPLSEMFGRRTIYMIATASFGVASVIVAVPRHVAGVFVGRFFQGIAAAIPATVAFGNFSDMFDAETRIWVVFAYTLFGMSGLALGPVYSSYTTRAIGWRWVFHISAITSAASLAACFLMKESNAAQILQGKIKEIEQATGASLKVEEKHQKSDNPVQDFFTTNVYRPITFLFTEPLVALCAILCAVAFGLIYGLTEALTVVYTTPPFDNTFDETTASLSFIAILVGEILNVFPRIYDAVVLKKFRKQQRRIVPESKIRSFAIACPALATGLWVFAWTVPQQMTGVPWPVSMIGLICIGFAANDFSHVLFGYITDSYGFYAASAVSSLSTARTLTAAIFPLFITQMYKGLGNNYATTLLAGVATLFCFTPVMFLKYGEKLRGRSDWAVKGDDVLEEDNWHMQEPKEKDHGKNDDTDTTIYGSFSVRSY